MAIAKSFISRLNLVLPLIILGFAAKIASAQPDEADAGSLKFTTLYSFSGSEGENPNGMLLQATNGDFYGTTVNAGARCILPTTDCGTIFKITPSGGLTAIHSFCFGLCASDGSAPDGLVQATNGYLYGTTTFGGANCPPNGCGTIFKISPTGTLTTLYSFCSISGCPDGYAPLGLVQAPLWDNWSWRHRHLVFVRMRNDLQSNKRRCSNDGVQLLRQNGVSRRLEPLPGLGRGRRWRLLRDNLLRWHKQHLLSIGLWDAVQNHSQRHGHNFVQLLLTTRMRGWRTSRQAGARRQRGPLWSNC
jgi:uncharacterized repeat protein (TIGR03803 family)